MTKQMIQNPCFNETLLETLEAAVGGDLLALHLLNLLKLALEGKITPEQNSLAREALNELLADLTNKNPAQGPYR